MKKSEVQEIKDLIADSKGLLMGAERIVYANQDELGVQLTNKIEKLCSELENFQNRIDLKLSNTK